MRPDRISHMTTEAEQLLSLYTDEETGKRISTHSMLKTFRRCPRQAHYKYVLRLKPKSLSKPLRRGTWMHSLLETHHGGEDWEAKHKELSLQFSELFDEEKEKLGDLPRECRRLMKSYLWHYKDDEWKVHDVEFILETELPDGTIYRCKIDLLMENQYGLWIVDHKSHATLPNFDFRLLDAQSALYVWCAWRNKLRVQGHIWNYLKTKPPTVPQLLKDGSRLSAKRIETDYVTFVGAIKHYGLDPQKYAGTINYLRKQRYRPGEMQTSPFFRRDVLEKSPDMLRRVAQEAHHTSKRMHSYPFDKIDSIE